MGGKRLNIGVDVDGVLSDFLYSARTLLKQMFNGRPDDNLVQTSWAFQSLGVTDDEEDQLWRKIDSIPNWWLGHRKLPNTDSLVKLNEKHRVIFITNRKDGTGYPIEDQTKLWLKRTYGLFNPTVVISDNKGPLADGLNLHYFIDDRPKNVEEVSAFRNGVYLQDGTYNKECKIPRVASFDEFVQIIERENQ